VFRGRLEAADGFFDDFRGDPFQFVAGFTCDQFGKGRSGGNGGGAAADLVTHFGDTIVFESNEQPQHVAAGGVGGVDPDGGRRKFAGIARILEMVEQTLAMHSCFNYRVDVVAAVIERDGRILICQRKGGRHAGKWEFPGGKIESGETPPEALTRELREELGIEAQIGEEMSQYETRYGKGPVLRLRFYHVTTFAGEPQNLQFEDMVWEERGRLGEYDFLEGDREFLHLLAAR
jgi:mutator protein MutT